MNQELIDCFACKHYGVCHYQIIFSKMISDNPVIFKQTKNGYWRDFHSYLANVCNSFDSVLGEQTQGHKRIS